MKAVKVMIAAAVVAALFIALPFASAVSDAEWAEDGDKAAYFSTDPEKMTFDKYKEIMGITSDQEFASDLLCSMGYKETIFDYSDFTYKVTEFYGGKGNSLCEKELTDVKIISVSIDFEFTATVKTETNPFASDMEPFTSEIIDYLEIKDKDTEVVKVTKGDKFIFSGSVTETEALKEVKSYKDFNTDKTGLYYKSVDGTMKVELNTAVKYVKGDTEKEYEQTVKESTVSNSIDEYEMDDDEEFVTDGLYLRTDGSSIISSATVDFYFDHKHNEYVMDSYVESRTTTEYYKVPLKDISSIKVKDVDFKDVIPDSPLTKDQLKTLLEGAGTISDSYADVDDAYESYVNPAETPVNQGLFFGAFIFILVVVVVIAAIFREKKTE